MIKVLVPFDGSKNSEFAIQQVANQYMKDRNVEVHVLNVQPPLSRRLRSRHRCNLHPTSSQR